MKFSSPAPILYPGLGSATDRWRSLSCLTEPPGLEDREAGIEDGGSSGIEDGGAGIEDGGSSGIGQDWRVFRMGKTRKPKRVAASRSDPVGLDSAIAELERGMDQVGKRGKDWGMMGQAFIGGVGNFLVIPQLAHWVNEQ